MKVSERCYAVTGLGYSPPWSVNAGFVAGGNTTLIIDTGGNALAAATIFGYATAAKPGNRLTVINTEKHFDHIGGNSFFEQQGIEIWGHAKLRRTGAEFAAEVLEFNSYITNPARRRAEEAKVFFSGTSLALPNRALETEHSFDLGNCHIDVLLTPGHTDTNISVWAPHDRVLYCGDCLINGYMPNLDASTPEGWRIWLNSLDRIESLHPETVVCGHGPVAKGAHVQAVISTVRSTLRDALLQGRSPTT